MRFSLGANAKPRGFPMSAKSARESVVVQSPANNLRSRTPPCRSLKPNLLDRCELGAGRPHPNVRLAAGRLRAAVREGEAESLEFPPREESEVAADDPAEAEAAVVLQDMARFLPADLKRFLATGVSASFVGVRLAGCRLIDRPGPACLAKLSAAVTSTRHPCSGMMYLLSDFDIASATCLRYFQITPGGPECPSTQAWR